jgi:uncharacterized protein YqiB (DUF1249 family)
MIVDSLCLTSWRARPVSFVSLMTLYESNYIRLRALVGDVRRLAGRTVSSVPGDIDLHLEVLEHSPYTSILRLTHFFADADAGAAVAEPDLEVRVYHDARLAEASRCPARVRHPALAALHDGLPATLGERWRRNMLLNKWLDYCAERGHRIQSSAGVACARP